MRQNEICVFNTYASCDTLTIHASVQLTQKLQTAFTDDRWRNTDQADTLYHLTQLRYPLRST
jgi:hypothetical protein